MHNDQIRRDTKGGDFSDRIDLEEIGGSTSDGILEVASNRDNLPVDDFWADVPAHEDDPTMPGPPDRPDRGEE